MARKRAAGNFVITETPYLVLRLPVRLKEDIASAVRYQERKQR
jgi:hypothetical protein